MTTERAVLAGGCFWGMQDLIRPRPSVISTSVGYSGGEVPNATYRNHGNHAEAIEIVFDPAKTSLIRRRVTVRATISARATARPSSMKMTSRSASPRIPSTTSTLRGSGPARS